MPPDRPTQPTSLPHLDVMLTDDGSRTLRNRDLNETYHSGCGALSECWHVYLRNSGIEEQLRSRGAQQLSAAPIQPVRVLEIGFGTGMGWLITAAAAEVHRCPLQYMSLETELLPAEVLAQIDTSAATLHAIQAGWLPASYSVLSQVESRWLAHRAVASGVDSIAWQASPLNHLEINLVDAREWLITQAVTEPMDAIYFDAFSPATNPELWQSELFALVKAWLSPDGRLVSYCVSGAVRRALQQAGFEVTRHPGPPGGKREVLVSRLRPV